MVAGPDGGGVVYIVTGAGGARLYKARPVEEHPDWLAAFEDRVHSFTKVTVVGDELSLEQIDLNGKSLDRWTMRKQPLSDDSAEGEENPTPGSGDAP